MNTAEHVPLPPSLHRRHDPPAQCLAPHAPHRWTATTSRPARRAHRRTSTASATGPTASTCCTGCSPRHRLDENWALRAAIRTADRVNLPLVIHQGLDPTYPHASDRHHTFILQGARDTARDADVARPALPVRAATPPRRRSPRGRPARRARLRRVHRPLPDRRHARTHGALRRTRRAAACWPSTACARCPAARSTKAEYAARTIRPKIARAARPRHRARA